MSYTKTNEISWDSVYKTCKEQCIKIAEILIVCKYPVNTERIIGFSEITQTNVNVALVLWRYQCKSAVLTPDTKPEFLTDNEWQWLIPKLQEANLFNHKINVFWRDNVSSLNCKDTEIQAIRTNTSTTYVYTPHVIRLYYVVGSNNCPKDLIELFNEGSNVINAIYVRQVNDRVCKFNLK